MPTPDGMRLDEAVEQIEDLQAKLVRAEDIADYYKKALISIANEDYRGPRPSATETAYRALEEMRQRYGS